MANLVVLDECQRAELRDGSGARLCIIVSIRDDGAHRIHVEHTPRDEIMTISCQEWFTQSVGKAHRFAAERLNERVAEAQAGGWKLTPPDKKRKERV